MTVRHIVMWRLQEPIGPERDAAVEEMRVALERLVGIVPGLRSLTVRANTAPVEENWHVALHSDFESLDALAQYQVHPEHLEAVAVVKRHSIARACVDYPLD